MHTQRGWRGGERQLELLLEGALRSGFPMPAVLRRGSALAARCARLDDVTLLRVGGSWDLAAAWRLARHARGRRAELLAAHDGTAHTLALWAARMAPGLRLVVHRRVLSRPRWTAKYRTPRVAGFIAVSRAVARVLRESGVREEAIRVVYDAVDAERFAGLERERCREALRLAHAFARETFLIGAAAQLEPAKGVQDLIEACRQAQGDLERLGAWALLVAGEGPERARLERQVREAGLEHHVRFEGFVEALPRWLAGLDLFVLPSRREGLGSVALEAALAGVARVVTDVGGLPEIVEHERTGLVVPAGSPAALAQAIVELRAAPERARALAERAAAHVRQAHAPERMVRETLAAYAALAAQSK